MSSGRAEEEEEETTSSISSLQTRIMHVDADESSSSPLLSQMPPIKSRRGGLSKYYQGKSQSFSSFSDLATVGDLAKKESTNSYNYMRKPFISYDHEQDHIISSTGPPAGPSSSSTSNSRRGPSSSSTSNSRRGHGHGSGACATTSMIARTTSGCSYFSSGKPPPPTNTYDYTHAAQQQHI